MADYTPKHLRKSPCPHCGKLISWNNAGKVAHSRKCNYRDRFDACRDKGDFSDLCADLLAEIMDRQ